VFLVWCSVKDHHRVLLSMLYQLVRCLLGLTAVLVRRDLGKDAELLVWTCCNQARSLIVHVGYLPN
jgi:hypothetical protein